MFLYRFFFYLGKYRYLFFYRFFPCLAYRVCMKNTKNMKNMVKKKKTGMKIMFFCSNVRILCLNHFHIHHRVECTTTTGACMHINTLFRVLKKSNFLYFGKFSNIFPTWKSMTIVGKSPKKIGNMLFAMVNVIWHMCHYIISFTNNAHMHFTLLIV